MAKSRFSSRFPRIVHQFVGALSVFLAGALAPAQPPAAPDQALVSRVAAESDDALRQRYRSEAAERRLYARPFDRDVAKCIERWNVNQDAAARDQAVRALRIALEPWSQVDPDQLAASITAQGSHEAINLDLRDACLHFAQLASLTGDLGAQARAKALIERFAATIPTWPIWSPYYGAEADKKPLPPDQASTYRGEFAAGPWGAWIYMDMVMAQPLLEAWSILREMPGPVPDPAKMRALFTHFPKVQRLRGDIPDYSNMDAFQIRGQLWFGLLMPDPELVHEGVRHLQAMYRTGFYPDGWWHEGATSYHKDLQQGLRAIVEDFPETYTDPPGFRSAVDGQRFDALSLSTLVGGPSARADAVTRDTCLPNGFGLAVHDSDWQDRASFPGPDFPPSRLFGAMGQGTLASGGNGAQTLVTLHYGPSGSHAHHDALNLNLWSKGKEVISETNYRPVPGSNSTRAWHTSTAGHATVVVDERDQDHQGPHSSHVRSRRPEDAIPGIADWSWRWTTCAPDDFGRLRLFATDFDRVQVIEADATASYDAVSAVKMYRRTVALVQIDGNDTYVVDIFRIRGGAVHDLMLHACLQDPYEAQVSAKLSPRPGTLFGMVGDLRSGRMDKLWVAAFRMPESTTLYTFVAPGNGTEVITGNAPAMRRVGDAPFVVARRAGPDTDFICVHHASTSGASRVRGLELLPVDGQGVVAFRVVLDTRSDVVISADDPRRSAKIDGRIDFTGAFAHIAEGALPDGQWLYLVDGSRLAAGDRSITGDVSTSGTVTRVERVEAGAKENGFVTPLALPEGRNLFGQTLLLEPDGLPTWAYRLNGVRRVADGSELLTTDEPGLVVEGELVKQVYFPNWGNRGVARFRIPGSALLMPSDGGGPWKFWTTGAATAKSPDLPK